MRTTKKTNHKTKAKAALSAATTAATPTPAKKSLEDANKEFEQFVNTASAWSGERGVSMMVTPMDAIRLRRQSDAIRVAVTKAGGREKVPEAVLLYQQTLDDAASFIMAHGFERVIHLLVGESR